MSGMQRYVGDTVGADILRPELQGRHYTTMEFIEKANQGSGASWLCDCSWSHRNPHQPPVRAKMGFEHK